MKSLVDKLRSLHTDEQGADMVEYILIIAAVALPLLALVVWFWKDIRVRAKDLYEQIMGDVESNVD